MNDALRRMLLAATALALVAAACSTRASATPVDVALSEFKIVPQDAVPAGKSLALRVHNEGQTSHSMAIEAGGKLIETRVLDPEETETLEVPALDPGTYKVFCTVPGHREAGMETTFDVGGAAGRATGMSVAEMDGMEEGPVKAFPAKTQGTGGRVLKPRTVGGAKVFDLRASTVRWETSPGTFVEAFGFNGGVPGPEIHARRGDRVRIVVHNELPQSTSVHLHGLTVPNAMDGVPFITQQPIRPGETFTYAFTVKDPAGTYMYHSHYNALEQVGRGLYGAFVVDPEAPAWDVAHTVFLGDGQLGYTINGKSFPATAPIIAKRDQRILVRFLNAGQLLHPMHMHGFHFRVVGRDGRRVPDPYEVDTLVVAPGERYDVIALADLPGVWAFHCHVLSHVEGPNGMHGMVTAVIVK